MLLCGLVGRDTRAPAATGTQSLVGGWNDIECSGTAHVTRFACEQPVCTGTCHASCDTCHGNAMHQCLSCRPGYGFTQGGMCVPCTGNTVSLGGHATCMDCGAGAYTADQLTCDDCHEGWCVAAALIARPSLPSVLHTQRTS